MNLFYVTLYVGTPEIPVDRLMTQNCCQKIVTCFKFLSQSTIENLRSTFYSLSETQQTQLLIDYMLQHSQQDGHILYTVGGHAVCEACFRMVYGLRYNRFASVVAKFKSGIVKYEHGRLGRGDVSEKSIRIINWLRMFVEKVGDKMPTSQDIHLPSCLTKADVYALVYDDLSQGDLECCKQSAFYDIWQRHFPNVKIPKVHVYLLYIVKCVSISNCY